MIDGKDGKGARAGQNSAAANDWGDITIAFYMARPENCHDEPILVSVPWNSTWQDIAGRLNGTSGTWHGYGRLYSRTSGLRDSPAN